MARTSPKRAKNREIPFIDGVSTGLLRSASWHVNHNGRRPGVTKTELVEAVARDLGLSRVDAQRTVETVFGQIADGLARDQKVQIQGFGTFQTKVRKERMGINPQTKEPMKIPASKTVGFKPGQDLKNKV